MTPNIDFKIHIAPMTKSGTCCVSPLIRRFRANNNLYVNILKMAYFIHTATASKKTYWLYWSSLNKSETQKCQNYKDRLSIESYRNI